MAGVYSCIELLLVTLHVYPTLQLSTGSPQLESSSTVRNRLMQLLQALLTAILEGVLQTGSKVRDKLGDRPEEKLALRGILSGRYTYPL